MQIVHRILNCLRLHGIQGRDERRLEYDLEKLIGEILELEILERQRAKRPRLAFRFTYGSGRNSIKIQGENMTFTMTPVTASGAPNFVSVIGSPVKADGTTSQATLSNPQYVSSDPTVFTVAPDPATPNGAVITAVANPAAGTTASATLTETATATEPDGTMTEVITGVATIILSAPVVAPAPAAALVFTFGTPAA